MATPTSPTHPGWVRRCAGLWLVALALWLPPRAAYAILPPPSLGGAPAGGSPTSGPSGGAPTGGSPGGVTSTCPPQAEEGRSVTATPADVPEIDPSSLLSGLTLATGGLLILLDRLRRR